MYVKLDLEIKNTKGDYGLTLRVLIVKLKKKENRKTEP